MENISIILLIIFSLSLTLVQAGMEVGYDEEGLPSVSITSPPVPINFSALNISANRSDWWDNLDTPLDITALASFSATRGTFQNAIVSNNTDGGDVPFYLRNTAGAGSSDESVSIIAQTTTGNLKMGKIVFERVGTYGIPPTNEQSSMKFYTTAGGFDFLAFEFDGSQNAQFQANNIYTTGDLSVDYITATGDLSVGDIIASGNITAGGNVSCSNFTTSGDAGIGGVSDGTKLYVIGALEGVREAAHHDIIRMKDEWSGAATNYVRSLDWHDGGNPVGAIGTVFDGTTVDLLFHSLYNSGYKTESDVVMRVKGNGNVEMANDNAKLLLGTGKDASFYYNASDSIINPKEVGDGNLFILGDLISTENVTSENVFIPQYIFAHTDKTLSLITQSVWRNVTFDEEVTNLMYGIAHDSTNNLNHTFTILEEGIYDIEYDFDVEDDSVGASDIDVAGRAIFTNGSEIKGSVFEADITKQGIEVELSHEFLARIGAGDVIAFQFTADDADVQISTHGTFGTHPESASIVIEKIANIK